MKIYDYTSAAVIEVSDAQYDFMQAVIKASGRIEDARKEYPITDEQLANWKQDPVFWPILEGHLTVLYRSRGLTADYIKDYLLSTLEGKKTPSKEQMMAINQSVKALGMGMQPRAGFSGKVTLAPDTTKIEFNDGLDNNK